ncbi:Ig-like domain-containing protein [Paenibacillus sp. J5C_2022]|uniref:Ig-like domain-containing protein n=1 Tax=Paenibacillus sp. J5C2022 TaxID=2977129 RepID=UPI0021D11A7A|nr:Ig-like domain-containing protein [Paenibacillus sp. J5C2022]MCU6708546.1 Ig-like domain-containing protein [Paenibacillus sp. J5C2022]
MLKKQLSLVLSLLLLLSMFTSGGAASAAGKKISKLVVSKNEITLEEGDSHSLYATAVYEDGSTEDVTIETDWSTGSAAVAAVYAGTVTAKAEGTAVITATYMGKTVVITTTVTKKVKALSADIDEFDLRIDEQQQVELTAIYEDGSSESVTQQADWSVDNYSVATVVNGLVTGKKSGTAIVTAAYGNQSVNMKVSVEIARRLDINQSELFLLLGEEETVELQATYPDGTVENVSGKAEWKSDNEKVADAIDGVVKAYGSGEAKITASYGTKTASITVYVDATRKIELNKQELFMKANEDEQLKLTATYMDGKTDDITSQAKWTSSDSSIAFVSKGRITSYRSGEVTITAAYGDRQVSIDVDVEVPKRLELNKDVLALDIDKEETVELTATFADGTTEQIAEKAKWSSSNQNIASVSKGKVRGYKSGAATITAQYGGKSASMEVEVSLPNSLTLSQERVSMQVGDTTKLKVTANFSGGKSVDVTDSATWTSSSANIAEAKRGSIIGVATGSATVTVSYGTRSVSVPVSVGVVQKLSFNKKRLVMEQDEEQTLIATALYEDGVSKAVRLLAEWTSSAPEVASVYKGAVTAHDSGTTLITATFGGVKASIYVEVDVSNQLKANATSVQLEVGETQQIVLTSTDSLGTETIVTNDAKWSVSSDKAASVSGGLITGAAVGKTTVKAEYGGQTVSIAVEVGAIDRLEVDTDNLSMQSGQSHSLTLNAVLPDGRTKDVTKSAAWKSSNSKVAEVADGKVTAIGYGKAKVYGEYNGEKVTINIEVDYLKYLDVMSKDSPVTVLELSVGQKLQLDGLATYSDNSERAVTIDGLWSSSNPKVAHVKHGLITVQGKGRATVTLKFGNMKAKVSVVVK